MKSKEKEYPDHGQTIRQRMLVLLSEREMGTRELSQEIGIREKEIYEHLSHIARSASAQRKKFITRPCRCLACGYVFAGRKRLTPPGRCPRCKKTHLQRPAYRVS